MEKVALYRTYRPHNFDNLVGQDYVKTTLMHALKSNKVSHAYLFSGPRGTGKTSTARLLAKALNCLDLKENYEPCNKCEFCVDISEGRLMDMIEIDAASNRGIDEVRDLREKINFAPTRAKYKIYIIDEVHMMTTDAFNALLKTLEEPPAHAYFILATTEIHKIPETIISRCQRFDFKRISEKAIMTRLKYIAQAEGIEADDRAFEAIAKYVDGGLRDAIGLLDQMTADKMLDFEKVQDVLGIADSTLLNELYGVLEKKDTARALRIVHDLHDQGSDLKNFIHEFVEILRVKMLEAIDKGKNVSKIMDMIDVLQDAQQKMHSDFIPQLALEMAVVRLSEKAKKYHEDEEDDDAADEGEDEKEEDKGEVREHGGIEDEVVEKNEEETKFSFDLPSLKKNWARITERVKTPALRMSLKNAVPVGVSESDLTIQFGNNFYKDKVVEHDNRVELEEIIKELTGSSIRVLATVKELEIKSVVEEDREPEGGVMDEALSIFGGEVV